MRIQIWSISFSGFKGILWQLYKLGLKVPSGRDENDGIGHFAELGSSWPGEAKTWPKIALRVGGRAEYSVLEDGRPNSVPPPVPQHSTFPPVLQHVALFLATFWPLLASWSRVRPNDLWQGVKSALHKTAMRFFGQQFFPSKSCL